MLTPAGLSPGALAAMRSRPSRKSVGCSGSASGSQRRRLGVGASSSAPAICRSRRRNGGCLADGVMRYSQVRRASLRAMVKAVPESSSAYRP
ncbi:Uncharacterised protein [Acinetobacter baumannii]|nr:Uncharacterised protein [Acinetobacter baumannii]